MEDADSDPISREDREIRLNPKPSISLGRGPQAPPFQKQAKRHLQFIHPSGPVAIQKLPLGLYKLPLSFISSEGQGGPWKKKKNEKQKNKTNQKNNQKNKKTNHPFVQKRVYIISN